MLMRQVTAATAWFDRKDYRRIRKMAADRDDLPERYDDWLAKTSRQIADLNARGIPVRKVVLKPHQLEVFCRFRGLECDAAARAHFAAIVANNLDVAAGA